MPKKLQNFPFFAALFLAGLALTLYLRRNSPAAGAAAEIDRLKSDEQAALRHGDSLSWRHPAVTDGD